MIFAGTVANEARAKNGLMNGAIGKCYAVPYEVSGHPGSISSLMEAAACLKWEDRGEDQGTKAASCLCSFSRLHDGMQQRQNHGLRALFEGSCTRGVKRSIFIAAAQS